MSLDTSAIDRYRAALVTVGMAILENAEDTLWLAGSPNETAVDHIMWALGIESEEQLREIAKKELRPVTLTVIPKTDGRYSICSETRRVWSNKKKQWVAPNGGYYRLYLPYDKRRRLRVDGQPMVRWPKKAEPVIERRPGDEDMRPIPGYDGNYEITRQGDVWSHKHRKWLKIWPSKYVCLTQDGVTRRVGTLGLIARLFGITNRAPGHKITIEKAREIRAACAGGETQQTVADRYGLSRKNVGLIARNQLWKEAA